MTEESDDEKLDGRAAMLASLKDDIRALIDLAENSRSDIRDHTGASFLIAPDVVPDVARCRISTYVAAVAGFFGYNGRRTR